MSFEVGSHSAPLSSDSFTLIGTVLAIQANYYQVRLEPPCQVDSSSSAEFQDAPVTNPRPQTLLCTRRTRLKKVGQQVMVGDRVSLEDPDWAGGRGAIAQVLPRHSELDRPPVANADQILLMFALAEPELDPLQLSRFLVKAESTGLQVCLCCSKTDLVSQAVQDDWRGRLQQWGYDPVFISVYQQQGLTDLNRFLHNRMTIVCGPSGVGKSSLINRLVPLADLRIGAVSGKLARGRHTTRHVELFELPSGGLLADTPGFNQPELTCAPPQLAQFFPEARQRLAMASCQFSDCLHRDEPHCAVRGEWERYAYYLRFLDEAIAHQTAVAQLGDGESNLKLKTRRHGHQEYEPKLETKKYRRVSRRSQQQALQGLGNSLDELNQEEE